MKDQKSEIGDQKSYSDPWHNLRSFTAARIALGKTGISEPLQSMLQFRLAHAHARDAVYASMNIDPLVTAVQALPSAAFLLGTQAQNRYEYLQRPDLGRKLHERSVSQ